MKTKIFYLLIASLLITCSWSCDDDKPSDTSIFGSEMSVKNEFDEWLEQNYELPYNILYQYRYEDKESNLNYYLIPAKKDQSIRLAKIMKHVVITPYDEIAGIAFTKQFFPKMVVPIGNLGYNNAGQPLASNSEGGLKITLYGINDIDFYRPDDYVELLQICHREFATILHQSRSFSESFREISGNDYLGDSWGDTSAQEALDKGFVSSYSAKEYYIDFVEVYSYFITKTAEEWENYISRASIDGRSKLDQKIALVDNYFLSTWDIDIYDLRDLVVRKMSEVDELDLENL